MLKILVNQNCRFVDRDFQKRTVSLKGAVITEVCNRNNNQSHIKYAVMYTDIELRTQEALNAIANGLIQIYDVLAEYGEEVYNAIASIG